MGQVKVSVDEIYINLLLIAISRKHNFAKLVKETEEETKAYVEEQKNRFLPEGYAGLYYTELLSRKMDSSLGEAYNISERRKEEIIQNIIESFDPVSEAYGNYFDDEEDGIIEFSGLLSVMDATDEKEIMQYYADLMRPNVSYDHNIYAHYNITFRKESTDDDDSGKLRYSISIAGSQDFSSDYVYDSYEVWEGREGDFAEFIEKVIAEYRNSHIENDEMDEETEVESSIEDDGDDSVSVIEVAKPDIESEPVKESPKIIEELVTYIWDDTRTVDLLDKFEGYGQSDPIRYRRIVIKNTKYTRYSNKHNPGFNLVIERGRGSDYVGNVTFTEFKKGDAFGLAQHVAAEVTDEIIEQYIDKDRFYRFSKPYLLRAQNSSNRTGYGWEWDWSGGYGDYTEGTLYGETTNYFFVGVYVTTGYSYEASNRKPYEEKPVSKEQKTRVKGDREKVVFYEGKLNFITQNPIVQRYFRIETVKGKKYIPASYDEVEDVYYVASESSQKYKEAIENGDYEVKKNFID